MNPETVLEFWFGAAGSDREIAARQKGLWWKKDPQQDAQIRRRFEPMLHAVDELEEQWRDTARGSLALVILMDQLPRNMYRGDGRAFDWDPRALAISEAALQRKFETELRNIERVFLLMPFEHSEELANQHRAVSEFQRLKADAGEDNADLFAGYVDFAVRHREVISRFGRFPHRNQALNRLSASQEKEWLEAGGGF
ncbi:MAG: DUF924 domain-containing protein [Gammaproteobacteria bacterium]|nr:DUF924 domain-containing protein [Gammaproteobacteria bacterium]